MPRHFGSSRLADSGQLLATFQDLRTESRTSGLDPVERSNWDGTHDPVLLR
jgi:hypothetical protein